MPRPFTRAQARQNAAFLRALARTGNARLAARELGVHRATYTKRRAKDPALALQWEHALVAAHARLARGRGGNAQEGRGSTPVRPEQSPTSDRPEPRRRTLLPSSEAAQSPLKIRGGEPVLIRLKNGRYQLRLAPPGRMTKAAEQAFLRALSATANVRLSAAAAGFAHSSFYARQRKGGAFAREMRLALAMGYDRLEQAALAAALPGARQDDAWRRNDPPPIPPMTPGQALQLLHLHEKSVRQSWEKPHRRRRRGEPWETYTERLRAMWTSEKAREAEDQSLRTAARAEPEGWDEADEAEPPILPALEQVTGWSKAKPAPAKPAGDRHRHDPDLALFGGWRLKRP